MYKLLIADDEPLVQIGLQSMLNWADYQITLCGIASNGTQALEMIQSLHPDLVITDIKMPAMDGLELMEACQQLPGEPPVFIVLTCYDDFPYVKKALECQAADYVIKLGLTPQELKKSVERALQKLYRQRPALRAGVDAEAERALFIQNYRDKFLLKLIHNLFDGTQQFELQSAQLGYRFDACRYAVAYCLMADCRAIAVGSEQYMNLYRSTSSMLSSILGKYLTAHIVSLDLRHFCILFEFAADSPYLDGAAFRGLLADTFKMIWNYFSVVVFCAVGDSRDKVLLSAESYQEALQVMPLCTPESPVALYAEQTPHSEPSLKDAFNMPGLKEDLRRAFEEYDLQAFRHIVDSVVTLFRAHPSCYVEALDVTSTILHMSLGTVPDIEPFLAQSFAQCPDSYLSLYHQKTTEQIMDWLQVFSDSVTAFYAMRHRELKNTLVTNIMQYVEAHISEKLMLNQVASLFSISPNYLGYLFKKATSMGFSEYVTHAKISKAKYLMFHTDMKIYEIGTSLGFENSFYFSRVFKKVEGCSPRQYLQSQNLPERDAP